MTLPEIERAISQLSHEDLRQLAEWFEHFYADAWDEQIAEDSRAGRLDELMRRADQDFEAGRCKPL